MFQITLVVRKKALKYKSLAQDIQDVPYPMINWVKNLPDVIKNSKESLAMVTDGNHHATVCEQLGAELKKCFLAGKVALHDMATGKANSSATMVNWDVVDQSETMM